ncbi:hypothetical protein ACFQI7_26130 [Paenibacillus allorhizosphaerae]|uniref:DUF975 family protein n=1 Tax=Paenibacillus allorhizosphaerae TaxID=2849866 RepID=A0ABM8VJT1_9BACL|nr:hypothetical protein [Paenibacillus allorhizosphaerae]CAG7645783.1 hypothetical protein PAECIP111802_03603 [Paenibacillus allorhizosphaerae]
MKQTRRNIVSSSPFSSNTLSFKSPWIVFWWSAAFPGFGHILVNSYIWGFFLMVFEYTANTLSKINSAIYFTMTGQFETAKDIIEWRYFLVYSTVYVFAMWDSYRRCVDLNKVYQLAYRDSPAIKPFHFTSLELNFLEKKKPGLALIWSFLLPPLGYIYLQRIPAALFSFIWWGTILHCSHVLEGVHYTALGQFAQAKSILDFQWLLYIPSIYGFSLYDSYTKTVENNLIFEIELSRFLKQTYQQGSLDELYGKENQCMS